MNMVDVRFDGMDYNDTISNGVKDLCLKLLEYFEISSWELSIVLCDDLFIKTLNREYRGMNEATDVLSFSQLQNHEELNSAEMPVHAGDIIISVDTLKRNCVEYNVDINEEFKRLLVHGLLHLRGFTHDTPEENGMLFVQEKVLTEISGAEIF